MDLDPVLISHGTQAWRCTAMLFVPCVRTLGVVASSAILMCQNVTCSRVWHAPQAMLAKPVLPAGRIGT
jgi:hypothetical protein